MSAAAGFERLELLDRLTVDHVCTLVNHSERASIQDKEVQAAVLGSQRHFACSKHALQSFQRRLQKCIRR